ncbi:MAG TPA: hypothetical protein VLS27_19030, partial [Gammaproteobacteria bacterium]|nr:hypothetical protein [Gammaproteobacteria bacterium]
TLNASGPGSQINVIGPNLVMPSFDGVGIVVGRNGVGTMNVSAGAIISITSVFDPSDLTTTPNFDIGANATGSGTATISGSGSSLTLTDTSGNEFGSMDIARFGTGTLNILDGAFVANDAQGVTTIAREAGSTGTVLVEGTDADTISILDAGFRLLVGENYNFNTDTPLGLGTGGTGTLIIGEFGTVIADEVFIGTDGTIQGTGAGGEATANAALNAGSVTLHGGTIAPGFSAGTLTMSGDFVMTSGRLDIELGGAERGLSDLINISGMAELSGGLVEFALINGYVPGAGDAIAFLNALNGLSAEATSLSVAVSGVTTDFQFEVSYGPGDATFTALNDATAGNSVIFRGGDLDDVFEGGAGNDVLSGGGGSDRLTGGAGSDLFLLAAGDGGATLSEADFFSDFQDGSDLIGLTGGLTPQDVSVSASETGDAVISISGSGEILAMLQGVTQDLLDQSDFISVA